MEVGNIVDLQVRINHAVFWVLPHSSGAYLVEAVRCLCQDTVTQLFLRIPVFQTAYGISAQGCIQNLVGADHATCIAFGKAEIDCDPGQSKSICFVGQGCRGSALALHGNGGRIFRRDFGGGSWACAGWLRTDRVIKVYSTGESRNQVGRSDGSATRDGPGPDLAGQRVGELADEVRTSCLRSAPQRFASPMMIFAISAMTTAKLSTVNVISVPPEIS